MLSVNHLGFFLLNRELARFYALKPDGKSNDEKDKDSWKRQVEEVVFDLGKKWLRPPKAMAGDMTFAKVADLPDLYKVFERC